MHKRCALHELATGVAIHTADTALLQPSSGGEQYRVNYRRNGEHATNDGASSGRKETYPHQSGTSVLNAMLAYDVRKCAKDCRPSL